MVNMKLMQLKIDLSVVKIRKCKAFVKAYKKTDFFLNGEM